MGRIRTIKPEFFRHETLFEAERESGLPLRVAFAGLWTAADREGRFRWRPRQLALDILPFDGVDFARVLDELRTRGFIVRYTSGGDEYGSIPSWRRHQVINNRESASVIPAPTDDATPTREARVKDATGTPLVHATVEGEGEREEEISVAPQPRRRRKASDQTAQVVPCPYQSIVNLFHDKLPTLPRVKLMTNGRQKAMRRVWGWVLSTRKPSGERRATTTAEALGWFGEYFARAAENDFLIGRGDRTGPHAGWRCDIDFLLTDKGMRHVIEKTEVAA